MTFRFSVVALCALALAGCEPTYDANPWRHDNDHVATQYKYLGTVDGCRMWAVYSTELKESFKFVNCSASSTLTWRQNHGKIWSNENVVTGYDR